MILFQRSLKKDSDKQLLHGRLSELCDDGSLDALLTDYIESCKIEPDTATDSKSTAKHKARPRFPNPAGFCRHIGTGMSDIAGLRKDFPEVYDRLLAIFEDEALNSELSPTLLSAYMKKRLAYADSDERQSKEVIYRFEHDILRDGE